MTVIRVETPKMQINDSVSGKLDNYYKLGTKMATYPFIVTKCDVSDVCIAVGYPTALVRTLDYRLCAIGVYREQIGRPEVDSAVMFEEVPLHECHDVSMGNII